MKQSLFRKLFSTFMIINLVCLLVLGVLLLTFSRRFWINDNTMRLTREIDSISEQFEQIYGFSNFKNELGRALTMMVSTNGGEIFLTDTSGNVVVSTTSYLIDKEVSDKIIVSSSQNKYSELGNMQGLLKESSFIVGKKLLIGGSLFGYAYATRPASNLNDYIVNMLKLFLSAALMAISIEFAASYVLSARQVRPLQEMADAARCMSKGDFSRHISVTREDEIGQLAVAFNNMTKSLADGEQMRRGFVANVSHELKTPMTSISGFIDGILDGTISKDEQSKYLKIVSDEVKRLSRLVVAMLDLSRLEAGEMQVTPSKLDMSDLILTAALGLEQKINDKSLEIRGFENLGQHFIMADRDLIHQVVYNLIDNAVKYSSEGGWIEITESQDENFLSVTITNSGKGIPSEQLPHVFERFYKVDKSRGADPKGAGLGLYIVKTIIVLHNGQIKVSSTEGEFTSFTFSLPVGNIN